MKDYKKYIITQGDTQGLSFADIKEYLLTPNQYKRFETYMTGQTCGLIAEIPVVYIGDYENFISNRPNLD